MSSRFNWLASNLGSRALNTSRQLGHVDAEGAGQRSFEPTAHGPIAGVSLRF